MGAGGLGREVLVALQRIQVGQALEAGLAIVLLAVLLDRISAGFYHERQKALAGKGKTNVPKQRVLPRWFRNYGYWAAALLLLFCVNAAARYVPVLSEPKPEDAWTGRTGFVHEAVMADLPDLSGHEVYACGAPIMVESAHRDFVARCGLPEDAFYADSFTSEADKH